MRYDTRKTQSLGSPARVFEDKRSRPNVQEQRREAKVQRFKNVIAEITAENLDLKKAEIISDNSPLRFGSIRRRD